MENVSYIKLEGIAMELEIALNSLSCFNEFCVDEGLRPCHNKEDEIATAVIFRERLEQFISIFSLAQSHIHKEMVELKEYSEALRLAREGAAQWVNYN